MTDCSDAYWNAEETNLCEQVKEQILPRMRRGEAKHYSVFALAPQPLLIKFGTMINDLQNVRVYQKHREPNTWKWLDDGPVWQIELIEPSRRNGIPLRCKMNESSGCWETKWVYGASRFQTPTMTVSEMRRRSPCFGNVSDGPWTLSKPAMALRNCMYFRLCPLLPQSILAEFGCLKRICP